MQNRSADREIGFELEDLVRELDHRTCHGTCLGGDLQLIASLARDGKGAAHAHER